MQARHWFTLVLILAVAGLITLLWLDRDDTPAAAPITALTPNEIKNIRLEFQDADPLVFTREAQQWRITAPVSARAEASEIRSILSLAERVPNHSYTAQEMDLSEVGLAPAKLTVILNEVAIKLGDIDSLENNRYAQVGEQVFLIGNPIDTVLDADYSELVSRELLPPESNITKLALPGFDLTPTEQGGWQVAPSEKDPGADATQYTVDAWQRARALWIRPAEVREDSKVQPAEGEITINTQDSGTHHLQVIARSPQLILRDPALHVDYHLAAHLAAPLLDLQHPDSALDAKKVQDANNLKAKPDVQIDSVPQP